MPTPKLPGRLPPLQGPRLAQHPPRVPGLGPPGDRPEPGRRLRHPDRGDRLDAACHAVRLRRAVRHGAQPVLPPGGHRSPDHRLRQGRPDPRIPEHPGHPAVRRTRHAAPGGARRDARVQPVHRVVLGQGARPSGPAGGRGVGHRYPGRADRKPPGGARRALLQPEAHRPTRPRTRSRTYRRRPWWSRCSPRSSNTETGSSPIRSCRGPVGRAAPGRDAGLLRRAGPPRARGNGGGRVVPAGRPVRTTAATSPAQPDHLRSLASVGGRRPGGLPGPVRPALRHVQLRVKGNNGRLVGAPARWPWSCSS